jgi:hypothetical protein
MRQNLYVELRVLSRSSTGTSRIVFASISITNNSQISNEINVWAKINSPAKNKTEIMKNWRSICLFKSVPHLSHFRGVQRLISHTLNGDIRLSHFGHRIRTASFLAHAPVASLSGPPGPRCCPRQRDRASFHRLLYRGYSQLQRRRDHGEVWVEVAGKASD